jgi:S1-C subfamily serine protease
MEQKQNSDGFWKVLAVLLFIALIGTVAVMAWQIRQPPVRYAPSISAAKSHLASYDPGYGGGGNNVYWIADLAEKSLPFVVNVQVTYAPAAEDKDTQSNGNGQSQRQRVQPGLPPELRQLLPEPFGEQFQFQMPQGQPEGGEGSGFIYREDGYVVTNAHVIGDFDKFKVRMNDGKEYDAKLIGTDKKKDIAVLKIDKSGLPVAPLGDSDAVRVGEPVIAIGSPLGYEATVTAGIISANHRSLKSLGQGDDPRTPQSYLQTDAAINRGNSGGPLLNARGEVIGVNRAIARMDYDGFQRIPIEGIGFAIPVNDVKDAIDQIVKHGKVVYPGISAQITGVEDYLKANPDLKLDVEKGVYVVSVTVGGPADRAGIKAGDVILTIDGTVVNSGRELIENIQQHRVGDRVTLRVARLGTKKQQDVTVVLGELDFHGENADQ